jgi:large subunit ribosomal protein L21
MTEVKTVKKTVEKKVETSSAKFAVIKTGGKQYVVEVGKKYDFEKLEAEEGKEITFPEVFLVADSKDVKVGDPIVAGAKVTGKVIEQLKDKKVIVFKYKPKKRVRKTQGHRQQKTKVEITKIA